MVHPALEPYLLEARQHPQPHPATLSPLERRLLFRQRSVELSRHRERIASTMNIDIDLGDRTLASRLYIPIQDDGAALAVYFHGGGFTLGDLDTHDTLCRRLCVDTRMRFLAIDYRLAPEHPFPASVNDATDVIRYVAANLVQFGNVGAELIVIGDSAGATLATVAAVLTRHENLGIAAQVLLYPTLGPELLSDSAHTYATGYLLEVEHLRYDYSQYLGEWADHGDPRVSPLMFVDLAEAPPAIVLVAECDPLRDEGVAYAGLLGHFVVPVELLEAKGMVHGFLRMGDLVPDALTTVDDLAEHILHYVHQASA